MATPTPAQKAWLAAFAALIALGTTLGFVFTNGSPSLPDTTPPTASPTPTPTEPPKTTAPAPSPKSTSFRVAVWNEKSFPAMTQKQYDYDLSGATTSGWVKAPSLAYLGSEFQTSTGEVRRASAWAVAHPGWAIRTGTVDVPGGTDVLEQFSARSDLTLYVTHSKVFVPKPPGPASPARRYVATWSEVSGFKVVFLSLHLPNGCFARNASKPWYAGRCAALHKSVADMKTFVANEHKNGWTVIVGGDLNLHTTPVIWGARQRYVTPRTDMQLAVVPADDVEPDLASVKVVKPNGPPGLYTDHPVVSALFTLTRR